MAMSAATPPEPNENGLELPPSRLQNDDGAAAPTAQRPGRREQWADVASVVNLAVRGAFPSSPAFDPSDPAAFQAHWRGVFAWLHGCVVADAGIPTQLASPPVRRFEIRLLDGADETLGYPCCLPTTRPSIVLHNDRGVTKGDLVRGLAQYLFGSEELPLIYKQDLDHEFHGADREPPRLPQHRGPALPYEAGWMSSYDGIWVYCCPPDQFAKRIKEEREFAAGSEEQNEVERKTQLGTRDQRYTKTMFRL